MGWFSSATSLGCYHSTAILPVRSSSYLWRRRTILMSEVVQFTALFAPVVPPLQAPQVIVTIFARRSPHVRPTRAGALCGDLALMATRLPEDAGWFIQSPRAYCDPDELHICSCYPMLWLDAQNRSYNSHLQFVFIVQDIPLSQSSSQWHP